MEEPARLLDRLRGVVGQARRLLDAHEAVAPFGAVEDGAQDGGGGADVVEHQRVVDLVHALALAHQPAQILVVEIRAAEGLLEDGRVAGHPHDAQLDQLLELAVSEDVAGNIVEPGALSVVLQLL